MGALIILVISGICLIIWGCVRLTIWIIKTAVKEALREYDAEKNHGSKQY